MDTISSNKSPFEKAESIRSLYLRAGYTLFIKVPWNIPDDLVEYMLSREYDPWKTKEEINDRQKDNQSKS